ncbi:DUF4241 domain-containing protein [Caulobacter sp.]|jgi:hypothetical protein|uniref:DUF4241 domain-containing protein n=1 Tax=Caulobacter sp. TaxID=78 RepID=UPI001608521F
MFRKALLLCVALLCGCTANAQVKPKPDVLKAAFGGGFVAEADGERYPVRVVRLGELNLSSGRLMVADPFTLSGDEKALDLAIPPGRYPVDLAVADTGKSGHRIALARLVLSDKPPVRWRIAVTAEQDARSLKGSEVFGYGVDAGTGAFIDGGALASLKALPSDAWEALGEQWQVRGEAQGPKLGMPYQFALMETVGPGGIAMFSSGWGDGFYASWVGYDAQGRPTSVITDFGVIDAVTTPRD